MTPDDIIWSAASGIFKQARKILIKYHRSHSDTLMGGEQTCEWNMKIP